MPENNRILLKTLRMARVNRGRKAGKMEFDSSRKAFFESHNLEAKELPLIFHKDYICRNAERGNWHPNIEFLLVLEGEGMCTVGAENLEMHPGDLIAINSNQLHIIHSNSSVVYHCLILDSDFCLQNNIPTEKLYYQTMIHSEEANRLFLGIVAELEKDQPFQIAGIKCAVLQFLLFLSRNFLEKDRSTHAVHAAEDENMKLAIGYIQSHLQEKLSLEKICGEAGLSKFYFIRQFKKTTGMTPLPLSIPLDVRTPRSFCFTGRPPCMKLRCNAALKMILIFLKFLKNIPECFLQSSAVEE